MCDALEPHESYEVCELIRQLGALYDKAKEQGDDDGRIRRERQQVSARLMSVTARLQQGYVSVSPQSLSTGRES